MYSQRLTYLGLESFWWGTLLTVCFVVAVVLVYRIYRYERRLVPPPVGWGLFSLRVVLLLTLLLMALQPTLTWTNDLREQNRVIVALDVSESMDLIDDHASETERLQWAVGLGMIKPEMLDDETRARSALQAETSSEKNDAGTASAEFTNDQAGLRRLAQSWNSLSRFELARQLLAAPERGLLDRLQKVAQVDLLLFSQQIRESDPKQLTGARSNMAENLVPEVTSYTELLRTVASRENNSALIVVTDGVDTTGELPLEAANDLGGLSRPIFSLLAGSLNQPIDLAIESIDHPDSVYKKDQPLVRVRAGTYGYEGYPLAITLTDVTTGNRMTREVTGGERFVDVEFDLPLNTPGRQRFIVDVQPRETLSAVATLPEREEVQTSNNQQEFAINVIDDTSHVLLVDGEGRWEFRFLESAFERDERVDLEAVLFEQPYLGLLPQTFFSQKLPNQKQPGGPFEKVDLIIWGDADTRDVDQATWEQMEKFVAERGGTLVISSGKRHFAGLSQNPILRKLLPIEHHRPIESARNDVQLSPQARGFHLQLTAPGKQHPVMKLDTDASKNATAWENLPGHLWGLAGVPKPGAVVLATPTGSTLTASTAASPPGVIVVQNYGLGRVLWLGIDSTWRWRARTGDRDHYRFWGQLSRWAAEMRTSAGSDDVRFGLERSQIEVGEQTVVRARWSRKFTQNLSQLQAFVEVYPTGGAATVPILSFPLESLETDPLIHEARLPPLPVGDYELHLKARDVPLGTQPIVTELFVVARSNGENQRLSADRTLLDQFASVTNGGVFGPHQIEQLLERLSPESRDLQEKRDIPLWNHWFLFTIMLSLLAAEWLLRKWHGLP